MNCTECEQLFDAYLDGQLSGSLRLEFDAHRLRCQRCQQTLAMLETVGFVLRNDEETPPLRDEFADHVMRRIHVRERIRPRVIRFPLRRVAIVAATMVQAAAVLMIALFLARPPANPATPVTAPPVELATSDESASPGYQGVMAYLTELVDDQLWETYYNTGEKLPADVLKLAAYLDLTLPETYARESEKIAEAAPLEIFLPSGARSDDEQDESEDAADDVHSI